VPTAGNAGAELYWERSGRGEPLLLIQGMSGTHLTWGEPFLSRLEPDFDCVVFDNRGIGNSAEVSAPFTIAELADDALAVMDAAGLETAHVLGISMGGMVAQQVALMAPERLRTLTLGCTYPGGPGSSLIAPEDAGPLLEAFGSGDLDRAMKAPRWPAPCPPASRRSSCRSRRSAATTHRPVSPRSARRPWSSTAPRTG
jgi:3-oxoadipate enol-lactonase